MFYLNSTLKSHNDKDRGEKPDQSVCSSHYFILFSTVQVIFDK